MSHAIISLSLKMRHIITVCTWTNTCAQERKIKKELIRLRLIHIAVRSIKNVGKKINSKVRKDFLTQRESVLFSFSTNYYYRDIYCRQQKEPTNMRSIYCTNARKLTQEFLKRPKLGVKAYRRCRESEKSAVYRNTCIGFGTRRRRSAIVLYA